MIANLQKNSKFAVPAQAYIIICKWVGRHIARRNLRFCSDHLESGQFNSLSEKSGNVTPYGCVMYIRHTVLWCAD